MMKLTKDEVIDRIKNIHGDKYGGVDDINYINIVEKVKKKLNRNCNYDMTIDLLLFNIWND